MKNDLSTRELFLKVINFEPCPRTLKWELGYLALAVKRWHKEGLPGKNRDNSITKTSTIFGQSFPLPSIFGDAIEERKPCDASSDVSSYFNLDEGFIGIPINYWIFPAYKEKITYEDDTYIELWATDGIRKREYKDRSSMPLWLEYPVKNRNDWEKIKEERFSLDNITNRYSPEVDMNKFIKESKNRTAPLILSSFPVGFFGSLRQLMGDEKLLLTYYDDPELIKDMADHLCNLWISIDEELTAKFDFDAAYFWEDMSYKKGSLISPKAFKEFMTPYYKKFTNFIKSKGIKKIFVDTDGNVEELIPLFIEAGVNMMYPFERQAGNDLLEIRKKYPNFVIIGGFDKNTLYKGKDYIDKELEITGQLVKGGGYIPHGDHLIPQNVSWENFKYYREKLNSIIDNTKIL